MLESGGHFSTFHHDISLYKNYYIEGNIKNQRTDKIQSRKQAICEASSQHLACQDTFSVCVMDVAYGKVFLHRYNAVIIVHEKTRIFVLKYLLWDFRFRQCKFFYITK